MAKMQLEIPEELNKKLKIYSTRNDFIDKRDAVLFILEGKLMDIK